MKPISITLEGVASFTQPQTLDFTTLGDLFCINGRTGSGKSTILESIIIALYGKSGRKGNLGDYVNTKLDKASIDFSFTSAGSIYQVYREFYRKANKQGKAWLKKDGKLLSDRITEINSLLEGIIGLCRDDFTQVILLEQGQFNKFLSADKSERTRTVGNLFRLNRYKEIYSKFREKRVLLDAQLENLEKQLLIYQNDTQEYAKSLLQQSNEENLRSVSLEKEIEQAQSKQKIFDVQKEQAKQEEQLKKEIDEHKKLYEDSLKKQEEIGQKRAKLIKDDSKIAEKKAQIDELNKKITRLEEISQQEIDEKKSDLENLIKKYKKEKEKRDIKLADKDKIKKEYDDKNKEYFSDLAQIQAKIDVSDYEKRWSEILQNVSNALINMSECQEIEKTIEEKLKSQKAKIRTISEHEEVIAIIQKEIEIKENELLQAKSLREKVASSNAAAIVVSSLKEGDLCPVCGGRFTSGHIDTQDLSEFDDNITNLETQIKNLEKKLSDTQRSSDMSKTEENNINSQINDLRAKKFEKEKLFSDFAHLNIKEITSLKRLIEKTNPYQLLSIKNSYEQETKEVELLSEQMSSIEREGHVLRKIYDELQNKIKSLCGDVEYAVAKNQAYVMLKMLTEEVELHEKTLKSIDDEERNIIPIISSQKAYIESATSRIKGVKFDSESARQNEESLLKFKADKDEAIKNSAKLLEKYNSVIENLKRKEQIENEYKIIDGKKADIELIADIVKGDKFLEFVAEEYIEEFTYSASEILAELTGGKFNLTYDGATGEYYVKDFLSGGELRKISTLSGGENFLASLSIAIAISRQIAAYSEFEFFFLDEGFGTLDNEILDTVLEALYLLSKETTVGIITHCDALTENIADVVTVEHATEICGSKILH